MTESKEVVLQPSVDGPVIPYIACTTAYGRAELQVCAQWKRGKIVKLFIYPKQQGVTDLFYSMDVKSGADHLSPHSWVHKGIADPRPWLFTWCKLHKCMSMSIYVPDNTSQLRILTGSTLLLVFE